MLSVYDLILKEGNDRKIAFVNRFFPYYISSVGCHIFNLMNQNKKILVEGGRVANTRLHLLMVAFPGFCKTFFQEQFLDDESYSYIKGTKIKCDFEGDVTNAGFVGQIKSFEGQKEPVMIKGLCEEKSDYIIGIDEFSSITNAFKQNYNTGFDTNLLKVLDTGKVPLRRGPGARTYKTDLTLWAGVQPARYDLGAGFTRRLLFMVLLPTIKDIDTLNEAREQMRGARVSNIHMKAMRLAINQRQKDIYHNLRNIYFHHDFKAELRRMRLLHYDKDLFERLAIGYWIMKSDVIRDQLQITMTGELKALIQRADQWKRDVRTISLIKVMKHMIENEEKVNESYLFNILLSLGFEEKSIMACLRSLYFEKFIKKEGKDLIILKKT